MKVALLYPQASHIREFMKERPPLGIAYLAAYLEQKGHDVKIFDLNVEDDAKEAIRESARADIVGISVLSVFYLSAKELISEIRSINPRIPIVVGGSHEITTVAPAVYTIPAIGSTISITGFNLATISASKEVFCNQPTSVAGFSDESTHLDLLNLGAAGFASYALDTSFGPVSYPTPYPVGQFHDIATDLGVLTFTSYRDATFTALLGATEIPVLHPLGVGAMVLLLLAAGVLAVRRLG